MSMFDKHSEAWRHYKSCFHCSSVELKVIAGSWEDPLQEHPVMTCLSCGLDIKFNVLNPEKSILTIPYEQVGIATAKAAEASKKKTKDEIMEILHDEFTENAESEVTKLLLRVLLERIDRV